MISSVGRLVVVGLVLVFTINAASRLARVARQSSAMEVAGRVRDDLVGLRSEINACLEIRDLAEVRLQAFARETGEVRAQVDSVESLDPRGVPVESYDDYTERVEGYNEAIAEWEQQADELNGLALRCDSIVQEHNSTAESLQDFLVRDGIIDEGLTRDTSDILGSS